MEFRMSWIVTLPIVPQFHTTNWLSKTIKQFFISKSSTDLTQPPERSTTESSFDMMNGIFSSPWGHGGNSPTWPSSKKVDNLDPPLPNWGGIQSLIDESQVSLFDAFQKLSRLRSDRNIAVPQLVVVGDQSSGKSSLLEAIARFPFPVHGGLCTRFPIKLVLRRSSEVRISYFIEPGSSRSEDDRDRLRAFEGHLANTEMFGECMARAAAVLGVPIPAGHDKTRDGRSASQETVAGFTDDVLVVIQCGPHLPYLDVLDLPGIFQASSYGQTDADRTIVTTMVEKYIQEESNLVLLVTHAGNSYNNSNAVQIVQSMLARDSHLAQRLVGILTHPEFADDPDALEQARDVLHGRKDSAIPKWHVVKNWNRTETSRVPLQQRDDHEDAWFLDTANGWHDAPKTKVGTKALRVALKDMIWKHIQAMLPKLVDRLQKETTAIQNRVNLNGILRIDDRGRRAYLSRIALAFERFSTQGCQGTYINPSCRKPHLSTASCRTCDGFFGKFGKENPHEQDKKLRANIKALSTLFASALHECGRTQRINGTQESTTVLKSSVDNLVAKIIPANAAQTQQQKKKDESSDGFKTIDNVVQATYDTLMDVVNPSLQEAARNDGIISEAVKSKYYKHDKSEATTREKHERWVAERIQRWSGGDAPGETNPVVFSGLSEWQSEKWADIASKHLDAVWRAVRRFIDAVLSAACDDEDVRKALQEYQILPKLGEMEATSHGDLRRLLDCHGRDSTWFSHGFVNLARLRGQKDQLATHQGMGNRSIFSEKLLNSATDAIIKGLAAKGLGLDVVAPVVEASLSQVFRLSGKPTDAVVGLVPADYNICAASRVILQEESCYEMSMVAFVGYVNTWVVGQGILDQLPTEILTQEMVREMDEEIVEKIAGQTEAAMAHHARDKVDLQTMNEVMKTIKGYMKAW
ncbi:Dynamin-1-like protein [Fusarium austroafricanum]|uniref:Dynamin-1-like protein n=1 Tax=Fusarium austroafricanum TaxID=2364996 RepID=A0A8H4NV63_9HYPO|nr:Dynamin-1-like protein [Fusarium austroafricanum]